MKSLTEREREIVLWLRDFVDDAMGAADDRRFLRRAISAKKMCERWLAADNNRRAAQAGK